MSRSDAFAVDFCKARQAAGAGLCRCVAVLFLLALTSSTAWARHDPMHPQGGEQLQIASAQDTTLKLSTILLSPQRRIAVVNGHPVHVGELVGGYRVDAINDNEVFLSGRGKQQRLQLMTANVTKSVRAGIAE